MEPPELPPLALVPLPPRDRKQGKDGRFGAGNAGGRGPHFESPEVRSRILTFVRAGANWSVAARAAGINRQRLYDWLKKGREGVEPYATFLEDIEQAEAEAELRLLTNWSIAAQTDWRASRDLLRVRFRDRWDVGQVSDLGEEQEEPTLPRTDVEQLSAVLAAWEEAGITPENVIEADGA